jgi:hypothetical protein
MHRFAFGMLTALGIAAFPDNATAQHLVASPNQSEESLPVLPSRNSVSGIGPSEAATCCSGCRRDGICGASAHSACLGREVCYSRVEENTEKESCWVVKCEKVCVPAVCFPWEPGGAKLTLFSWFRRQTGIARCGDTCGEHDSKCYDRGSCERCSTKCGYVRCVRVLDSEENEVATTKCEWEIRRLPSCATLAE